MKSLNDVEQLGTIKHSLVGVEETDDPDGVEQFHPIDELGKEVDIVLVFEGADVLHDEGRGDGSQSLLFVHEMLLKFGLDRLLLGDAFEGIKIVLLAVADQKNIAELPLAQLLHHLELFQVQVLGHLVQVSPIILLILHNFRNGSAVLNGLAESAAEGLNHFAKCGPCYFSVFLHSDFAFVLVVGVDERTLPVNMGSFGVVRD